MVTRNPANETIADYPSQTLTDTNIQLYRSAATGKLTAYAEYVINEAAADIHSNAKNEAIVSEVRRQNNFVRNAAASVIGSIVFALLLFALGLIRFSDEVMRVLDQSGT